MKDLLSKTATGSIFPVEGHGPSWPGFAEVPRLANSPMFSCVVGSALPRDPGLDGARPSIGSVSPSEKVLNPIAS